jgi:protocatechuate 3,4-dioxygenase beta subunit
MLIRHRRIKTLLPVIFLLSTLFPLDAAATDRSESAPEKAGTYECAPTRPDMKGPFYKKDAPVRAVIGEGYLLRGTVRSAVDCAPVPGAPIEFWMAGPDGEYTDDYRATVISDAGGQYRLTSHFPPGYMGRPPHVHIRVAANGFRTLITQHYPRPGSESGEFDLVLIPEQP